MSEISVVGHFAHGQVAQICFRHFRMAQRAAENKGVNFHIQNIKKIIFLYKCWDVKVNQTSIFF
jgi:hypothetical protein